jgi:hypothetical protein
MSIFDSVNSTINSVFGSQVIYSYLDGSPDSTIKGVFENAFIEINGVLTKKPVLKNVLLSALSAEPVEGDSVEINSISYSVLEHHPDSFGTTTLILEKN